MLSLNLSVRNSKKRTTIKANIALVRVEFTPKLKREIILLLPIIENLLSRLPMKFLTRSPSFISLLINLAMTMS